jgi:polyphosphate glucokinase
LVVRLVKLVKNLPEADRVSAGFPGMVRAGLVLSAPAFSTSTGPGTPVDPKLVEAWHGFDLATALHDELGKPTRVANDADVQGAAVVVGDGLELVITLGTGFGTAVFMDGRLLPHLEIAHHPFRKGETYDQQLGEKARKEVGHERWNRRVRKAIDQLDLVFFFDHLYIGGGNARRVVRDELGERLPRITVVDNTAGILGGIKLWDAAHLGV